MKALITATAGLGLLSASVAQAAPPQTSLARHPRSVVAGPEAAESSQLLGGSLFGGSTAVFFTVTVTLLLLGTIVIIVDNHGTSS